MKAYWIFKYGTAETKCTSFPYAYRALVNALKQGAEKGLNQHEMIKQMYILSPIKDNYCNSRTYNYNEATDMARSSGLLTPEGNLNSREFKRR